MYRAPAIIHTFGFKVFSLLLSVLILFILGAGTAFAQSAEWSLEKGKGTKYASVYDDDEYLNTIVSSSTKSGVLKKVKSSKKGVIKAEIVEGNLCMTIKKPGKTTISYTFKGKAHKVKYIVRKYVNPVKSVKIGSDKLAGKKFKKYSEYFYGPYAQGAIKFNAKKGWKLKKLRAADENGDWKLKKVTNGTYKIQEQTMTEFRATYVNTKTGFKQGVYVLVGANYAGE